MIQPKKEKGAGLFVKVRLMREAAYTYYDQVAATTGGDPTADVAMVRALAKGSEGGTGRKTSFRGVNKVAGDGKRWSAQIFNQGKTQRLGYFETDVEAVSD